MPAYRPWIGARCSEMAGPARRIEASTENEDPWTARMPTCTIALKSSSGVRPSWTTTVVRRARGPSRIVDVAVGGRFQAREDHARDGAERLLADAVVFPRRL